jgi:hypothetical protein
MVNNYDFGWDNLYGEEEEGEWQQQPVAEGRQPFLPFV